MLIHLLLLNLQRLANPTAMILTVAVDQGPKAQNGGKNLAMSQPPSPKINIAPTVENQRGNKIPEADADALIAATQQIIDLLMAE